MFLFAYVFKFAFGLIIPLQLYRCSLLRTWNSSVTFVSFRDTACVEVYILAVCASLWRVRRNKFSITYALYLCIYLFIYSEVKCVLCIFFIYLFLFGIVGGGVHTGSTRHCGHVLAYCTCPGWLWGWRSWWNEMCLVGETEVLGEHLPRHHFVHHKSHLPDPRANPDRRGGKPATNRFSYGAGCVLCKYSTLWLRLS
jgi:hypothetical protein